MLVVRPLLLATLLPLFAGCQLMGAFQSAPEPRLSGQTRMQGTVHEAAGQLLFAPCGSARTFVVDDQGNTGIAQDVRDLTAGADGLFADVRGRFDGNTVEGVPGKLNLQSLYRVERASGACKDANFKVTRFYAEGQKWSVRANTNGLKLVREGQPDLAVPYLIEQMPGGGSSLSSDANNQHIELWVAPQRCASGDRVSFLAAELRIDDQVQRGCAYEGGAQAN